MMSSALPNRSRASFAAAGMLAVVTALSLGTARAQGAEAAAAPSEPDVAQEVAAIRTPNPFADRFPNIVLRTHEGRNVHFYDDLLKDKIVLINFMYATCTER